MKWILPVIVIAQFFCTSLWFAGNAIIYDLMKELHFDVRFLAHLTSAVQFGFIAGAFIFALLFISDRFSPSRVFFICSVLAAASNLGMLIAGIDSDELLLFRFITGFFLAGIYPVGMKIASDYFKGGLGRSLGFLVGALVVGTAFPHLLKTMTGQFPWRFVVYSTSILSVTGGLSILLFVPDGPFRKVGQKLKITEFMSAFRSRSFRAVAFGYFGHMWELYTFWAFVPVMLTAYNSFYPEAQLNVSFWSFLIIASGGLACIAGGILSTRFGARPVAVVALFISCLCCLASPLFLFSGSAIALLVFLFVWGLAVIADSPLFSSLVAQSAPAQSRGTTLTIVNCIGFSITILSIQFINLLSSSLNAKYLYMWLAVGPVLGLVALFRNDGQAETALQN